MAIVALPCPSQSRPSRRGQPAFESVPTTPPLLCRGRAWLVALLMLCLRWTLAAVLLTSVGDPFSLGGFGGASSSSWADGPRFGIYGALLGSLVPPTMLPAVAWTGTLVAIACAMGLVLGLFTRWAALATGALLLALALGMSARVGLWVTYDLGLFSVSALAFLLATVKDHVWALDNLRRRPEETA